MTKMEAQILDLYDRLNEIQEILQQTMSVIDTLADRVIALEGKENGVSK